MMTDNHQNIDLSRLGFEIHVPTRRQSDRDSSSSSNDNNSSSSKDLLLDNCLENVNDEDFVASKSRTGNSSCCSHQVPATLCTPFGDCHDQECVSYEIQSDDVSDIYYETDDDSYGDDDDDDDKKEFNRPTRARQLDNHRFRPQLQTMSFSKLACEEEDLGYEPMSTIPSAQDLGFGQEEPAMSIGREQLGYGEQEDHQYNIAMEARRSSEKRLSSGRPIRNRRSMSIGMEARRMSRLSTCSGTTASSKSSYRSGKLSSHSKKSRPSQRERMVTRSTSRRLSRKHPSPVRVVRTTTNETHGTAASTVDDSDFPHDISHSSDAYRQTLQDLGCSDLFIDSSSKLHQQRKPRRVSLEYGNDGSNSVTRSRRPKSVCLEFGVSGNSNSNRRRGSLGSWCTGMMPRRVSIEYHQTCEFPDTSTKNHGKYSNCDCASSAHNTHRILSRRGSLDYSVGTSTLPRRASLGKSHVVEAVQQEHHAPAQYPRRRATMGGLTVSPVHAARRNSRCGGCNNAANHHHHHHHHHPPNPSRNNSDSTKALTSSSSSSTGSFSSRTGSAGSALGLGRVTRRYTIAHIPLQQIQIGRGGVTVGDGRVGAGSQLTIKTVGGIEYLTRETVGGRWA